MLIRISVCLILVLFAAHVSAKDIDPTAGLDNKLLNQIAKKYGPKAKARLVAWKKLIADHQQKPIDEKVTLVNSFFNDPNFIQYGPDAYVWYKKDYWATPTEFLIQGAGDCEDYSIAKYFTLRALGVPDKYLQITYVKVDSLREGANRDLSHMVLSYFPEGQEDPLILDNIVKTVKPAHERTDLEPVYSFNGESLWLSNQRKRGRYVGSSERISAWTNLNKRLTDKIKLQRG